MRNWIYYWKKNNTVSTVEGRIGITILPHGQNGRSATTLGGWLLAIDNRSQSPDREKAVDLVKYLSTAEVQKKRFKNEGIIPTIERVVNEQTPDDTYNNSVRSTLAAILHHKEIAIAVRPNGNSSERFRSAWWEILNEKKDENSKQ